MDRATLLELAYYDAPTSPTNECLTTYDYLRDEMKTSVHGERFSFRDFSLDRTDPDRPSPFDILSPYIVTNSTNPEQLQWLAETAQSLVMPKLDGDALKDALGEVYYSETVQRHLRIGGSVVFLSNHVSYADIIAESSSLTLARLDRGEENPNYTQDVVAHRITSLFRHSLISALYENRGYEHQGGMVLEDVILSLAGDLQSMPSSRSGHSKFINLVTDGHSMRSSMNKRTNLMFQRLLRLGGRTLFIAGGGSQATIDEETGFLTEQTIGKGTSQWLSQNNQHEGAEQLLTIPIYMHIDPFIKGTPDVPVNPQPTPFAILEPRFLYNSTDCHRTLTEIISVGNIYKPSGVPTLDYKAPGPDWYNKRNQEEPKILIAHSV